MNSQSPASRILKSLQTRVNNVLNKSGSQGTGQALSLHELEIQPLTRIGELQRLYEQKVVILQQRVEDLQQENSKHIQELKYRGDQRVRLQNQIKYLKERNAQLQDKFNERDFTLRQASSKLQHCSMLQQSLKQTERSLRNSQIRILELQELLRQSKQHSTSLQSMYQNLLQSHNVLLKTDIIKNQKYLQSFVNEDTHQLAKLRSAVADTRRVCDDLKDSFKDSQKDSAKKKRQSGKKK